MQIAMKIVSLFSVLVATALLILTLMLTFGISKYVAFFGIFLAFYLAYLCWNRPRARTMTTVVSLCAIIILGSFLYTVIPKETVDSNPANYLTADDDFMAHAREIMPQTLEYASATNVSYRHMNHDAGIQYIRLDYSFAAGDFDAQATAFAERYLTVKEPFTATIYKQERPVYPIGINQETSYWFGFSPDKESQTISLLYLYDPRLTNVSIQEVLTDWHFDTYEVG